MICPLPANDEDMLELQEDLTEAVSCLLEARGYTHLSKSIPFFKTGLRICTARHESPRQSQLIHCIFESDPLSIDRIGVSELLDIKKNKSKEDHVILICSHISNQLQRALCQEEFSCETLTTSEVNPAIPRHYLVPNYRHIQSPLEIQQIENRFGPRSLFPKLIHNQDPIMRYFGFPPDSILEVIPKNQNPSIEYRHVIAAS